MKTKTRKRQLGEAEKFREKIILREIKGDITTINHEKDAIMRNQVRG